MGVIAHLCWVGEAVVHVGSVAHLCWAACELVLHMGVIAHLWLMCKAVLQVGGVAHLCWACKSMHICWAAPPEVVLSGACKLAGLQACKDPGCLCICL